MSDPFRDERVPLSMRPTIYREARFVAEPTWGDQLRTWSAEALDMPPGQALAALAAGGAVALLLLALVAVCVWMAS